MPMIWMGFKSSFDHKNDILRDLLGQNGFFSLKYLGFAFYFEGCRCSLV